VRAGYRVAARPAPVRGSRAGLAGWAMLAVVVAACDSPSAPIPADVYAFDLVEQVDGGSERRMVFHWPLGSTVRVGIGSANSATAAALRPALDSAVWAWNRAVLYGEYRLEATTELGRADVLLLASNDPLPVGLPAATCAPRLDGRGVTTFCPTDDRRQLQLYPLPGPDAGQVRKLILVRSDVLATPTELVRLVAHELGHGLGIWNHSDRPEDLMWGGLLQTAVPTPRDRRTIQALYHTPATVRP
jgi:predicted Zn-dependent protease